MSVTKGAFALVSLGLVLAVVLWEREQKLTPGPLHPVHAAVAELAAPDGCPRCHGAAPQSMAQACAACHEPIALQLEAGSGLHGTLGAADASRCGLCHREHGGDRLAPIAAESWRRAGVADPERYAHEHVAEFRLGGVHPSLACEACHTTRSYLGLQQTCTACHDDVHAGAFGTDCAHCHGQSAPFAQVAAFSHPERFPLAGAHAGLACLACHAKDTPHAIAQRLEATGMQPRACHDCHADPHRGGGLASQFTEVRACTQCHDTTADWTPRVAGAEHARFGPALEGRHAAADCRSCHARQVPTVPPLQQCQSCHESPHRAEFVRAASPEGCVRCHAAADPGFGLPSADLSAADHAASGFALGRPHADLACAVCHRPGAAWAARFPGRRADDCAACHSDPHQGRFEQGCTSCHRAESFRPTLFDAAAHARTKFPLTGAHIATACARCHTDGLQFGPLPVACASCHEDPHRGLFDAPGRPRQLGGREGCARCHGNERFDEVRWSGDEHRMWTGHALQGAHASLQCTQCHRSEPATPRRLGPAPRRCDQCHADPHAGQFRGEQGTDCARCHGEQRFVPVRFDHQRDARFALDANHRQLGCSACHKSYDDGFGHRVVRWRPLGVSCADCHDSRKEKDDDDDDRRGRGRGRGRGGDDR